MHQAKFYKKLEDNKVKCTACNQYCIISKGQTGICSVRQNIDGELMVLVYGNAVGVAIDPIEKKPLYHFLPGKEVFSFGTIGCNFQCSFCQNWDISQKSIEIKNKLMKEKKTEQLDFEIGKYGYKLSPQNIVKECLENNVDIIAYTYNEPTIFAEYVLDTAKLAKKSGIKNMFVSNGYESIELLKEMKDVIDAVNIDLKSFNQEFYREICKADLKPVLDTIKTIHKLGIWMEITTLIIPSKNDSENELKKIAEFIAGIDCNIPWHISAFHPMYKMNDIPSTKLKILEKAFLIGKKAGLKYVYIGNVINNEKSNTYCSNCNKLLIKRDYFKAEFMKIKENKCSHCDFEIKGVWE
ncbi:MAG: AmmeMemoRadiSam system radical SAM enzyme [Candidatus Woesearchaeota archaeon]